MDKNRIINFRCDEFFQERLITVSRKAKLTVCDFIRIAIDEKINRVLKDSDLVVNQDQKKKK